MTSAERLVTIVRRHQSGVLLDTNLLLLFLADSVSPDFAMRWSRTARFSEREVVMLRVAVAAASRLVTTPHVLTEATNFTTGGSVRDAEHHRLQQLVRDFALQARERFLPSRQLATDPAFTRLGLTDVAQLSWSGRRRPLVLTVDAPLTAEFERRGLPVVNLTNYAFPADEFA